MYIHNYQIHNVLNVFRKQLTKNPEVPTNRQPTAMANSDHVNISKSHRSYLMDRVSTEIVERISQAEPQKRMQELKNAVDEKIPENEVEKQKSAFTYMIIDENNRKFSHTLPIEKLSPLSGREGCTEE